MKLPVLHNFNVIKGETITLNVGYTNMVDSEAYLHVLENIQQMRSTRQSLIYLYLKMG